MNVDWQMFAEKLKRHGMESKIAGSLARSLSISMSGGGVVSNVHNGRSLRVFFQIE